MIPHRMVFTAVALSLFLLCSLQSGTYTLLAGTVFTSNAAGIGQVLLGQFLDLSAPELVISGTDVTSFSNFSMTGGKISGAGTFYVGVAGGTNMDWLGGSMEGSGQTVVRYGSTLNISGNAG